MVLSTMPAMTNRKKMTPSIASTPMRQLSSTQLTLSATAMATRQMPNTVKKITERRRPRIMGEEYRYSEAETPNTLSSVRRGRSPGDRREESGRFFRRNPGAHLRNLQIPYEAHGP